MEEVTYSHIPIATIVTAFLILAPFIELVGYRRRDLRYDRFSKGLVVFAMILFSPGAALGTGIPMFIIGLYPEFWSRWSNLFFWPLVLQFVFFTLEVIFLFFAYYLTWDRMKDRKPLHIAIGFISMIWSLAIQIVWDATGGYMMTTNNVPFPAVDQPVGWSAAAFFNPSFPFLFSHRFFGNLSYVMLLTGGVFALRYMFSKDKDNKTYFRFAIDVSYVIGFLAFFAMPFIGWFYASLLQTDAPVAFQAMMGGHSTKYLMIKLACILIFLTIAGVYLFTVHRKRTVFLGVATALLASLYIILSVHPALDWFGNPILWRLFYTVLLGGLIALFWLVRNRNVPVTGSVWSWLMFGAGLAAFLAFAMGGFMRERAKSPYTVYGEKIKPEVEQFESDRFLVHEKCLGCHHWRVSDIKEPKADSWKARIAMERARDGVDITDEEAERIIGYLEEYGK